MDLTACPHGVSYRPACWICIPRPAPRLIERGELEAEALAMRGEVPAQPADPVLEGLLKQVAALSEESSRNRREQMLRTPARQPLEVEAKR